MTDPMLILAGPSQALVAAGRTLGVRLGCAVEDWAMDTEMTTMVHRISAHAPKQIVAVIDAAQVPVAVALCDWLPRAALSIFSDPISGDTLADAIERGLVAWHSRTILVDPRALDLTLAGDLMAFNRTSSLAARLDDLARQLDERKWVERAKGLLAQARGLAEAEAFRMLRTAAMHANLKLVEISRMVVDAADWAEALNRSGQLRMLSQRLVRLAAQELASINPEAARRDRIAAVARIESNLEFLDQMGSVARVGDDVVLLKSRVLRAWQSLRARLDERPARSTLSELDTRAGVLLEASESLTDALALKAGRSVMDIVSRCGRQRMRVQRLAKDALLSVVLHDDAYRITQPARIEEFSAALAQLSDLPLVNDEIRRSLETATAQWRLVVLALSRSATADGQRAIVESSDLLLETLDQLTAAYEHSLQVIMS